jgi:hypothetical protein
MPSLVLGIIASLISGGLAGATVSVISNRIFHWRELRTKFYPVLNNMFAAYAIRMQDPNGRYWITTVGYNPSPEDEKFVEHRSSFIAELVEYNELKEVRILRKQMLDNMARGNHTPGEELKLDLLPESKALGACFTVLHKKLKLLA